MTAMSYSSSSPPAKRQRAPEACLRCRKKKYRCTGERPCTKCQQADEVCDYSSGDPLVQQRDSRAADDRARLASLEATVHQLVDTVTKLQSNSNNSPSSIRSSGITSQDLCRAPQQSQAFPPPFIMLPTPSSSSYGFPHISPLPHTKHDIDGIRPRHQDLTNPMNSSKLDMFDAPVRPGGNHIPALNSRGANGNGTNRATLTSALPGPSSRASVDGHKGTAEERLTRLVNGVAPFQPLTWNPSEWEERDVSRDMSAGPPTKSRDENWAVFEARAGPSDDPISTGLVTEHMANCLLDLFFDRCHRFMPLVQIRDLAELQRRSSYLLSAMLSIASRFYPKHRLLKQPSLPELHSQTIHSISQLAYSHLAATLFRKSHQLLDVHATMLLAGWALKGSGQAPDSWFITGHCLRLARSLGLHRTPKQAVPKDPEEKVFFLNKWRTWLVWYYFDAFLSIGFGRPQVKWQDDPNYKGFLALSKSIHTSTDDTYIASLTALTQIGQDMIPARGECFLRDSSSRLPEILNGLNQRLDDWKQTWMWQGSMQAVGLGEYRCLAKLQFDHIRICLNALALRPQVRTESAWLKMASDAAMDTINTHSEEQQANNGLGYSIDYYSISLAQAAVFLIRLHVTETSISPLEEDTLLHYLSTVINILRDTDISETRLSTYLSKICGDLCRVAGLTLPSDDRNRDINVEPNSNAHFDLDMFLQLEGIELDVGYMLNSAGGEPSSRDDGMWLNSIQT